jgi:hypothetical protein
MPRGAEIKIDIVLTAGILHLEDTLLRSAVLESIYERSLDGEHGPLSVGGGAGRGCRPVHYSIVAALYGWSIYGQIEGRHCVKVSDLETEESCRWGSNWDAVFGKLGDVAAGDESSSTSTRADAWMEKGRFGIKL